VSDRLRRSASDDSYRPAVYRAVPDGPGFVVPLVGRHHDLDGESLLEFRTQAA
jgi:hypothetical protein